MHVKIAQLVEYYLAKVEVEGSNPFFRKNLNINPKAVFGISIF